MNAISPETRPQLIMIRASQSRGVALGDECPRDLEQEVAGEEDARADPEHARIEAEVGVHRQRGVRDVDAVDVRDGRDDEERQHHVPVGFSSGALRDGGTRRARAHAPAL
jgi:hypothetical protein